MLYSDLMNTLFSSQALAKQRRIVAKRYRVLCLGGGTHLAARKVIVIVLSIRRMRISVNAFEYIEYGDPELREDDRYKSNQSHFIFSSALQAMKLSSQPPSQNQSSTRRYMHDAPRNPLGV